MKKSTTAAAAGGGGGSGGWKTDGSLLASLAAKRRCVLVRTAAGDAGLRGRCLLKFRAKKPVTVVVLHDTAAQAQPLWLLEKFSRYQADGAGVVSVYKNGGGGGGGIGLDGFGGGGGVGEEMDNLLSFLHLGSDPRGEKLCSFAIYTCSYPAGATVTLGGNSSGGAESGGNGQGINMYLTLVISDDDDGKPSSSISSAAAAASEEDAGDDMPADALATTNWAHGGSGLALLYSKMDNLVVAMPAASDFANPSKVRPPARLLDDDDDDDDGSGGGSGGYVSSGSGGGGAGSNTKNPLNAVTNAFSGVPGLFGGLSGGNSGALVPAAAAAVAGGGGRPKVLDPSAYALSETLSVKNDGTKMDNCFSFRVGERLVELCMSVDQLPGAFERSKLVVLRNRYCVVNAMADETLLVRQ